MDGPLGLNPLRLPLIRNYFCRALWSGVVRSGQGYAIPTLRKEEGYERWSRGPLLPPSRVHDFTICCKGCGANIPAPVENMPVSWIVTQCPLCGDKRRYLPSDIFRGRLSKKVTNVPAQRASPRWD